MGYVVLLVLLQSLSSAQLSSVLKNGELTVDGMNRNLQYWKCLSFLQHVIFSFHHEEILAKDVPLGL